MSFTEAVRSCFRHYATFSGRAQRSEYWWFFVFIILGNLVASAIDSAVFDTGAPGTGFGTVEPRSQVFGSIFQLATFLPLLAVGWRRLHDSGRPGWPMILPLGLTVLVAVIVTGGFLGLIATGGEAGRFTALVGPAAALGAAGLAVIALVQIVFLVLLVWWLTRPTQPGPNRYGPEPAAFRRQP